MLHITALLPVLADAANPFLPAINLIMGWLEGIRAPVSTIIVLGTGLAMWLHWQMAKQTAIIAVIVLALMWAAPSIASAFESAH